MSLLRFLTDCFKSHRDSGLQESQWHDGVETCMKGEVLFGELKHREALHCFDRAIACGFDGRRVYGLRGSCLQSLGFELDAIDDFSEAIQRAPEEAANYFSRALSKQAAGDFTGAISDFEEAIRLSKAESPYNDFWNDYAQETGWSSATARYEAQLSMAHSAKSVYEMDPGRWHERVKKEAASWRRPRGQLGAGESENEAHSGQGQGVDETTLPASTEIGGKLLCSRTSSL